MTFIKGHIAWNKGIPRTEETKKKISDTVRKNPVRYWAGKNRSEETKKKLSEFHAGLHPTKETRIKMGENRKKEKHWRWSGDDVSYNGIHKWIKYNLGSPAKCEHCGKDGLVNTKNNNIIHWANKDHKYRRKKEDWIRLCKKCHIELDKEKENN